MTSSSKVRQTTYDDSYSESMCSEDNVPVLDLENRVQCVPAKRRISTKQSPILKAFYKHHVLQLTLDSGAEITPCTSAHLGQWCGDYTMYFSSPSTVVRRLHHALQLTFDSGAEITPCTSAHLRQWCGDYTM